MGSGKIELDIIRTESDAQLLAPEWHALALTAEAQPFGLPAAALTWFRHLGRGELHIITARNGGGELIGLAPMHRRMRGRLPVLEFLGRGLGAIGGVLVGASRLDVAGALVEQMTLPEGPALDLVEFQQRGRGLEQLRRQRVFQTDISLQNECPIINLKGFSDGDAYLSTPERSGLRKNIAKSERHLGDLCFQVETGSATHEIALLRPAIDTIYDAAELAYPRLHLGRAPYADFFSELLQELSAVGCLTVLVGTVNDQPAAFDLYVVVGGVAYAILGRIDPDMQQYSPGHLLLRAGIDWAINSDHHVLDLQIGNDEYKLRWSSDTYDTVSVIAAPPRRFRTTRSALQAIEAAHSARSALLSKLSEVRS